jgi:5'-nucleotidase
MDETVVLSVTGKQLLLALENGVSQYPKQEGRFPQVRASSGPPLCASAGWC